MPYQTRVLGVRVEVEGSAAEDAERAEQWLSDLLGDDLAAGDLARDLMTVARDAPSVRAWVLAEGEELELTLHRVGSPGVASKDERDRERVAAWNVVRGGKKAYLVDDRPDLGAIATELARKSFAKVGKPQRVTASAAKAAWAETETQVKAALVTNDATELRRWLTSTDLTGTRGVHLRSQLVRALLASPSPESGEALLEVLRSDVPEIAHLVSYRIYTKKGLAERLLDELAPAWKDRPRSDTFLGRLVGAISEWPDFPYPAGYLEAAPTELRALLDARYRDQEAAMKPKLGALVEATVQGLESGEIKGFRRVRKRLEEAKPEPRARHRETFETRLRDIAGRPGAHVVRGAALDLLLALGVAPAELGALTEGLPETGGVRELRLAYAPQALPAARVVPAAPPSDQRSDSTEALSAATLPGGSIVVNRKSMVLFALQDGRTKWRATGFDGPVALAVLGDPGTRVYVASKYGLHALDAASGRELWCASTVDVPLSQVGLGYVTDPRPTLWALDDRVLVMGSERASWLDARTGQVLDVAEIPFRDPRGLVALPEEDAVVVLDGTSLVRDMFNVDLVPSGLVIRRPRANAERLFDGLEDRVVPRTLGSVVRELGGVRAELSTVDGVVVETRADGGTARARFALPPDILRFGPAVLQDGAPHVLVRQAIRSGIFDDGRWLAVPLSVA